jgi:hypothetical protein
MPIRSDFDYAKEEENIPTEIEGDSVFPFNGLFLVALLILSCLVVALIFFFVYPYLK